MMLDASGATEERRRGLVNARVDTGGPASSVATAAVGVNDSVHM